MVICRNPLISRPIFNINILQRTTGYSFARVNHVMYCTHQFGSTCTVTAIRHFNTLARCKSRIYTRFPFLRGSYPGQKKKVVILGTGWASMHFLKFLNPLCYDIVIISPRNYFTFTPLLPAVCAGTLSPLSCIEPVRNFTRQRERITAQLYEAVAHNIDFNQKSIECINEMGDSFSVAYDYLILGLGADTNTLGIPGVEKYALFLKEVEHAIRFRKTVMNNFERASLPSTSESEKQRLLHFAAVGGGPTGVETMAELSDFIQQDMSIYFPELISYVRLTLVEMADTVLPTFSPRVSSFTMRTLLRHMRVNVLVQHAVTAIHQKYLTVESKIPGQSTRILNLPYGVCLWAVGVSNTPLATKIIKSLPELQSENTIITDAQLRVLGTTNVYAIGDCKKVSPPLLKDHIDEFIKENKGEVPCTEWFRKRAANLCKTYPQIGLWKFWKSPYQQGMTKARLEDYLNNIDRCYSSPPATAQNARQEGLYLATVFNEFESNKDKAPVFIQKWYGALAYVGHGRAVATLPGKIEILGGFYSHPMWMIVYLLMQLSFRSRCVVLFDWIRFGTLGRDVGRDHVYIPGEIIYIRDKGKTKEQHQKDSSTEKDDAEVVITPPLTRALSPKLLDIVNV